MAFGLGDLRCWGVFNFGDHGLSCDDLVFVLGDVQCWVFPILVTVTCPVMTYVVVVCLILTWYCGIFDFGDLDRCCDVDFGFGDLFCTDVLFVW